MGSEGYSLHILFFPFMAQGHMLPMVDMAKLFAARGVKATILTTPANAHLIQPSIDRAGNRGRIDLCLVPFPSDTGLPEGCENISWIPNPDSAAAFFEAVHRLREPFGAVVKQLLPDCVVTDMFLPWTYDVAAELDIPRIVFHGVNFFSLCVFDSFARYKPLENLPREAESLIVPGLPHEVKLLKSQVSDFQRPDSPKAEFFKKVRESDYKSYGVVVNSFYELEPEYVRHYRKVIGRKAWHVGPVALCNKDIADKSKRPGFDASIDSHTCLNWLDSKSPGSVIYVCFGSLSEFLPAQLREIALGLEASRQPFIWVVRKGGNDWIPDGFEKRVEGRGLVIRGWAPQILILNHPSVGGFLTHCGWNSSLEGISAGLPLVTWPLFAEQFYNERLIVDVLKIGVAVGVKECVPRPEEREVLVAARVEQAVREVMDAGEEAEERRRRAKELGEAARRAVEEGGSSYVDMGNLIQELMNREKNSVEKQTVDVRNMVASAAAA